MWFIVCMEIWIVSSVMGLSMPSRMSHSRACFEIVSRVIVMLFCCSILFRAQKALRPKCRSWEWSQVRVDWIVESVIWIISGSVRPRVDNNVDLDWALVLYSVKNSSMEFIIVCLNVVAVVYSGVAHSLVFRVSAVNWSGVVWYGVISGKRSWRICRFWEYKSCSSCSFKDFRDSFVVWVKDCFHSFTVVKCVVISPVSLLRISCFCSSFRVISRGMSFM